MSSDFCHFIYGAIRKILRDLRSLGVALVKIEEDPMMVPAIYHLIKSCLVITVVLFGAIYVCVDLLFHAVPLGVLLASTFSLATFFLRVPQPDKSAVEAILGPDPSEEDAENNGHLIVKTAAHRGAGFDAPENSLIAFKLCAQKGVQAVEFDVLLTADNVPIIFHDDSLERMADVKAEVGNMTWAELSKIDISVKHPHKDRFKNTFIPTLEDAVKQLCNAGQHMFIDLKGGDMKMIDVILTLFENYPDLHTKAIVTSFYPHLIYFIRRKNPKIVCSLAWRPYVFSYKSFSFTDGVGPSRTNVWYKYVLNLVCDTLHEWSLSRITYYLCGISLILLHKDAISGKTILDWREKGVRVVAWTVNHPLEKQHFSRVLKVTYLTDTLIGEATAHMTLPV